jgi:hypothetical protein
VQIKEERVMILLLPTALITTIPQLQALVAGWTEEANGAAGGAGGGSERRASRGGGGGLARV